MSKASIKLIFSTLSYCLLLSACSNLSKLPQPVPQANITISLSQHSNSPYQKINATFTTRQPPLLVYRVISDLSLTPTWFDGLQSIEPLEQISNNNFVLRSVISSPWPFKDRELLSCVSTKFSADTYSIKIKNCAERLVKSPKFIRVTQAQAHWQISRISNNLVKVTYSAWLDPAGNVPAYFYNLKLAASSKKSLTRLRLLIEKSQLEDYPY